MDSNEEVYLIKERLPGGEVIGRLWRRDYNPRLNSVLQEEQAKAGLGGIEIVLLASITQENVIAGVYLGVFDMVEVFDIVDVPKGIDADVYGIVGKLDSKGKYYIGLYPHPTKRRIWRDNFPSERDTIRHDVGHIKFGDCDRELPQPVKKIFNLLIAEPRANWYERKGR